MQAASFDPVEALWRASVRDYPTDPRGTEAVETLISSIEELLCRIPAAADSEMGRMRARAINALTVAKAAVAENAARAGQASAPRATSYFDAWVSAWPRSTLAAAGALGLVIGICSSRLIPSRPRRSSR